ncbi:protein odr-4 homolog [Myzus persicae]|uniref:protein odr-4 homolog n=1 Tax=Myzus persicae TaxID=13164 RepID=UPI000B935CE4|nr:protein odr-4 homolog [Myzus persicae]XP_022176140.1 protein odr-4 homolog [Myzus persicae]XP_022176141.1 protein odr-4 homolog [Myzus persicae]XP_022176142.1 protein odr-4 homolog [Myzus persicae]
MTTKVFIEEHLDKYLKSLVKGQSFIPGVIIGQVIGNNYHVVHLSAMTIWNEDIQNNKIDVLSYKTLSDLLANSDTIFQKSLEVATLLPGGSHVLGLFFIVPQDLKTIQPINIDFCEFNNVLNEHLLYKKTNETWNYLMLNYSTVNKKSFCYSVDFNRVNGLEKTTYKAVDAIFGSFDNDWVTLIGTFNFGALERLNVGGGPKALFSIRDSLLDKFESVLNESIYTFNGCVCDENKTLKDFECDEIDNLLKNVVKIEFYRKVDLGNECKNASLKIERGKGKILMSGLCSVAVPFNRNGTIKDAIKAIHEDAMQTFATRLKMHLESMVEEESLEEEDGDANIVHETPRRILIIKTEGSRFAFSDYVFPGETSQEALYVAGEILNLPEDKIELYDVLEKGRHSYYETLQDIDSSPPQDASTSTSNNRLIYFSWAVLILAILVYGIKQVFV